MKRTFTLALAIIVGFCYTSQAGDFKEMFKGTQPKEQSPVFKSVSLDDQSLNTNDPFAAKKRKKRSKGKSKKSSGGAFNEGNSIISLGYGFPNLTKSIFNIYQTNTNYKNTGFGPLHFKYEYALSENFGLGLSVNMVSSKVQWDYDTYVITGTTSTLTTYQEGFKFSSMAFNIRANYHFVNSDALDIYYGIGIGYNYSKSTYFDTDPQAAGGDVLTLASLIPLGLESTLGMRMFFSDNIGGYLELGGAKSLIQAGVVLKF